MVHEKPGMRRIFIAVNIPEEVKRKIGDCLFSKMPNAGIKAVNPENMHITLRFMGYMDSKAVDKLTEKLEALGKLSKFYVELRGIGHFNWRVLWIGMGRGAAELMGLAEAVDKCIGGSSEFSPHITLARNKDLGRNEFGELATRLEKLGFSAGFEAGSFEVMESELAPNGPKYSVVRSIALCQECK